MDKTVHEQNSYIIRADIAARTLEHKAEILPFKLAEKHSTLTAFNLVGQRPLAILAHGDSWFDYPLDGNIFTPFHRTDIIAQLKRMGSPSPLILNVSHYGDATTDELGFPKQQRMIEALEDKDNWFGTGKPDAILFSGGGNDIVGDKFAIYLDFAGTPTGGLNDKRFDLALGAVQASYLDLFQFRDRHAPDVHIFGHSYDFPLSNGTHPACIGPWVRPAPVYSGWLDLAQGRKIVKKALLAFNAMLVDLAADPTNKFCLINTQGQFADADWANELHPYPTGFKRKSEAFEGELRKKFPTQI